MELSTGIEVESDFGESSGDEWELEDISSSSDESTTPIFIRQFSSSDMPSTSSASTSTTRSRRGRPVKRRWSRGRRSSREDYVLPSPPQPEPVVTPRHTQPVHLEPPPSSWPEDASQSPSVPTFTGLPKINILCEDLTPMNVLNKFIPNEFFEIIKDETNLYASQKITASRSSTTPRHSLLKTWKPVTIPELKIFFAIMLHTGLVRKPQLRLYWATSPSYAETFCPSLMSRNRFTSILWMLHFNDVDTYIPYGTVGHDPLHKIRPIINLLHENFEKNLYPNQKISLDEGTCPFKGRLRFRTYNPAKPHKWGIKLYQVCDAESGYCFGFKIATGVGDSTTFNIVMDLCDKILDKGHILYMDRYYSSPKLYDALSVRNTCAVGTCLISRKEMPKEYLGQKVGRGSILSCRRGKLLALKWKDKKDVIMLSTVHNDATTTVSVRAPGGRIEKLKPVVVDDYNRHMAGVDKSDQMLSYYGTNRKTVKWYIKLFFHLINLALVNSQKVHNLLQTDPKKKLSLLQFTQNISEKFAQQGAIEESGFGFSSESIWTSRFSGKHFPAYLPATPSAEHPIRACRVCSEKASRDLHATGSRKKKYTKRTSFMCDLCEVPLCVTPCFRKYHTQQNYWEE